MTYLHRPLARMRLTQPFGVDYLGNGGPGGQSYADIGLKNGHNGWDLSCITGTEIYAACDGIVYINEGGQGYGNDIRLINDDLFGERDGLEITYGHLLDFKVKNSQLVTAGQVIAHSDNTGFSTGPHLHFGTRPRKLGQIADYNNGFYGYVDPTPYFSPDILNLPVDDKYGEKEPHMTELQWYEANAYFYKTVKRLMTTQEKNALVYGYWSLREVIDPVMYATWTEMTKPAYLKKIGKL